jgi:hypothetical protein
LYFSESGAVSRHAFLSLEVGRKDRVTNGQPIPGDNQYKHTARLEPAIAVLKEYPLHPAVLSVTAFKIIWRIQV